MPYLRQALGQALAHNRSRDGCEMALAHDKPDQTEGTHSRSGFLDKAAPS